jgi:hypothetical protein
MRQLAIAAAIGGVGQIQDSQRRPKSSATFIVAFELTAENGFEFLWPTASMKPAQYGTVLLRINEMPWSSDRGSPAKARPLSATACIKVNGRNLDRNAAANAYPVQLYHGRLRVSASIPSGVSLHPEHSIARISLHQLPAGPKSAGSKGQGKMKTSITWRAATIALLAMSVPASGQRDPVSRGVAQDLTGKVRERTSVKLDVRPSAASAGDVITVYGTDFGEQAKGRTLALRFFDGSKRPTIVQLPIDRWSSKALRARLPALLPVKIARSRCFCSMIRTGFWAGDSLRVSRGEVSAENQAVTRDPMIPRDSIQGYRTGHGRGCPATWRTRPALRRRTSETGLYVDGRDCLAICKGGRATIEGGQIPIKTTPDAPDDVGRAGTTRSILERRERRRPAADRSRESAQPVTRARSADSAQGSGIEEVPIPPGTGAGWRRSQRRLPGWCSQQPVFPRTPSDDHHVHLRRLAERREARRGDGGGDRPARRCVAGGCHRKRFYLCPESTTLRPCGSPHGGNGRERRLGDGLVRRPVEDWLGSRGAAGETPRGRTEG